MLVHSGEKPHVCSICGKMFSQSGSRNVHMKKRHSDESRDTGEALPQSGGDSMVSMNLNRLMLCHMTHGSDIITCSVCSGAADAVVDLTPEHFGKSSADSSLAIFIKTLPYCGRMLFFVFISQSKEKTYFIINVLILLAKFHIHKCKFSSKKTCFVLFIHEVEHYINLISGSNNKKAVKTISIWSSFTL